MIGERLDTVLPHSQFFFFFFSAIYKISVDQATYGRRALVDY